MFRRTSLIHKLLSSVRQSRPSNDRLRQLQTTLLHARRKDLAARLIWD